MGLDFFAMWLAPVVVRYPAAWFASDSHSIPAWPYGGLLPGKEVVCHEQDRQKRRNGPLYKRENGERQARNPCCGNDQEG